MKTPAARTTTTSDAYLGQRYIDLAFTRYYQQRFDRRQLAEYLNMKPKSLPTFAEKFAGGGL